MALSNILALSQIAGHVVSLILSGCVAIPLFLHLEHFNGHCLLFATGNWQEEDGLFNVHWASQGFCDFPISIGILLFIVSAVMIYRLALLLYKQLEASFLELFLSVLIGILLCGFLFISAIMITLGFLTWCSNMTERFPACDVADGQNITKEDLGISTSGFYAEMGTAQFGAWAAFASSVGLTVFALLKLINNHQVTNMRVSMFLERQRLVNEDVFRENLSDVPTIAEPEHNGDGDMMDESGSRQSD